MFNGIYKLIWKLFSGQNPELNGLPTGDSLPTFPQLFSLRLNFIPNPKDGTTQKTVLWYFSISIPLPILPNKPMKTTEKPLTNSPGHTGSR